MSWSALLLAAAAAAALLLLALKLRGGRRRDLLGPPKAKPRLSPAEMEELTELAGRGDEAEALRRLKSAGYDESGSRRLIRLMARLGADD